ETCKVTATGLTEGTNYVFRVMAENKIGLGEPVELSQGIAPKSKCVVPDPPQTPVVDDITAKTCVVTWQPPLNDGGAPILGYHIERHLTSSTRWIRISKDL
ncbi:unnamed protein product, partial [Owenia fusiformis]